MYKIYTDGSARNNKCGEGIGAHGFAVIDQQDRLIYEYVAGDYNTTNNREEMLAVIEALEWVRNNNMSTVIYTDSNLVYRGITEWLTGWKSRGWRKADKSEVLNKDLWMRIDELLAGTGVFIEKVPGHKDNKWNNYVDKMVQTESAKLKAEADKIDTQFRKAMQTEIREAKGGIIYD